MYTIVERARLILTSPAQYFRSIKKEIDIIEALKFLAVVGLISAVLAYIIGLFFGEQLTEIYFRMMTPLFGELPVQEQPSQIFMVVIGVITYIMQIIFSFAIAAILFVWLKIFGVAVDSYAKVYQLYVYGNLPTIFLSWIPFLGFVLWIWDIVLLVIGTNVMFGTSKGKAAVIYIVPIIILVLIFILFLYVMKNLLLMFPPI